MVVTCPAASAHLQLRDSCRAAAGTHQGTHAGAAGTDSCAVPNRRDAAAASFQPPAKLRMASDGPMRWSATRRVNEDPTTEADYLLGASVLTNVLPHNGQSS